MTKRENTLAELIALALDHGMTEAEIAEVRGSGDELEQKARLGQALCAIIAASVPDDYAALLAETDDPAEAAEALEKEKRKRAAAGAGIAFLEAAIADNPDECRPWPFGCSTNSQGRKMGIVMFGGKKIYTNRYIAERAHGPKPFPGAEVCHDPDNCTSGLCCTPKHMRWGTRSNNGQDRASSDTESFPMKKLTPEAVVEIYYNLRNETTRALCKRFDIKPRNIYRIRNGEHLRSPARYAEEMALGILYKVGLRKPFTHAGLVALDIRSKTVDYPVGAFVGCVIEGRWLIDLYDGQPGVFQMIDLAE